MALAAIKITLGVAQFGGGDYYATVKGASIPPLSSVVADTATLVADGASPTQGHVNTLNTDVTALNTALSGDVVVVWDGSVVTNKRQLQAALRHALRAVDGGHGGLSA